MFRKHLFLFTTILSLSSAPIYSENQDPNRFNFLVFSDMHLDIYPKTNPVVINPLETTNNKNIDKASFDKLFNKIVEENIPTKTTPNFIISLGDVNAHNASRYPGYKQKDLYTAFIKLDSVFPLTPKFNIFGNNDSPEKNYGLYLDGEYSPYNTLMSEAGWKDGFLSSGVACESNPSAYPCINKLSDSNKTYGYFTAYVQKDLKLIAMNSVLFSSSKYTPSHVGADEELEWLNSELQNSVQKNENVLIAMHIPMGKGWLDEYNEKFADVMSNVKPGLLIGILAGHSHVNELRVIRLVDAKRKTLDVVPMIMTPGIAPVEINAPGFRNFIFTKKNNRWAIQDIVTYSFQQKLPEDPISLVEYYKFDEAYCPGMDVTVSECLKNNLGYNSHSTYIKSPASDLMNEHYTNGNLNYKGDASAKSWIISYEIRTG